MKNIKQRTIVLGGLLAMFASGAACARGDVTPYIGVQFYFPDNTTGYYAPSDFTTPALTSEQQTGVVLQRNWNPVALTGGTANVNSGTDIALNNAGGSASGVSLTFNSNSAWWTFGSTEPTTANETLLAAESKTNAAPDSASYTLSGVQAGTYDLIVYIANDDASLVDANYTVGSTTFYVHDEAGDSDTFTPAYNTNPDGTRDTGNYITFENIVVPADGGTITLTDSLADGSNGASVNGFQLVAVPEPASLSLLGFGSLALLARRRRPA